MCEQEKFPHKYTDQPDCPISLFERCRPSWFSSFVEEGGIGVVSDYLPDNPALHVQYAGEASVEYVDLSELDGGSNTRVQCLMSLYSGNGWGKIRVHENRIQKTGITQDEYPVFLYQRSGKGGYFYSGLPFSRLITVWGDTLRKCSTFSDYSERIVSIDKHYLLKSMRAILIKAFHQHKRPYVYLDYFPNGYQSAVTFRVDVDGVFGENLLNLSKSAIANEIKLTFFINKSLCEGDEKCIQAIDPYHEVGNHANVHNLFSDYESNYQNVLACKLWLEKLGYSNNPWFAAPRGLWNHPLHQALEDLAYVYTSDFGVGIAGFPFFPYINGKRSHTLQIPVHPFSAERASLWRSESEGKEATPEFVADYYEKIIEENYSLNYPSMLYSHPEKLGEMANFVFERIHQKISSRNIWKTTLTEFALWWKQRDNTEFEINHDLSSKKIAITGNLDHTINIKEIY